VASRIKKIKKIYQILHYFNFFREWGPGPPWVINIVENKNDLKNQKRDYCGRLENGTGLLGAANLARKFYYYHKNFISWQKEAKRLE
jgi:hypothetical protein